MDRRTRSPRRSPSPSQSNSHTLRLGRARPRRPSPDARSIRKSRRRASPGAGRRDRGRARRRSPRGRSSPGRRSRDRRPGPAAASPSATRRRLSAEPDERRREHRLAAAGGHRVRKLVARRDPIREEREPRAVGRPDGRAVAPRPARERGRLARRRSSRYRSLGTNDPTSATVACNANASRDPSGERASSAGVRTSSRSSAVGTSRSRAIRASCHRTARPRVPGWPE